MKTTMTRERLYAISHSKPRGDTLITVAVWALVLAILGTVVGYATLQWQCDASCPPNKIGTLTASLRCVCADPVVAR